MRTFAPLVVAAALAAALTAAPAAPAGSPYPPRGAPVEVGQEPDRSAGLAIDRDAEGNPYVAGEVLVTFAAGAGGADKRAVAREADASVEDRFGEIDAQLLTVPEIEREGAGAVEGTLQRIESDPEVESAGLNYVHHTNAIPNDALLSSLWGLSRIRAFGAWDRTTGQGALINVLDSGIVVDSIPPCNPNAGHQDIGGVVSQHDFFHSTPTVPDDCAEDNNQHGTHTAGTSAARANNGVGIAGVAPGAGLLIGKVCEDVTPPLGGAATCPIDRQIDALLAAGNLPTNGNPPRPDVINMSLGGAGTTQAHHDAVRFATGRGIVLVVSAGNENDDALKFPAAFPESIAVASTNIVNGKSQFSNFGPWVDIAAPGGDFNNPPAQDILSTIPFGPATYGFLNGTSMSAPHVTGVAALLAAQGRSASRIRYRMESGAQDLGAPGRDDIFGHGLVDANEATLPAAQTKACAAANLTLGAARDVVDGQRDAVDGAEAKKQRAKNQLKKAKRTGRKVDRKKRKLRRAKRRLREAKDALAAAEGALAAPTLRQAAACNDA